MNDEHFATLRNLITQARRAKFVRMARHLEDALIVGRREYLKAIGREDTPNAMTRVPR